MNENGTKRREWVKTVAIIFLVILLILTFFSNTIMNYSLPEVAAQYIQSGTITAKIRGNGMIESGDPYNVKITGVRKVESVEVRQGDTVTKGEVLCLLSAEDSTELQAAKEALELAEKDFELALLTGTVDTAVMNKAGTTDTMENYKTKIIGLQKALKTAEEELKAAADKKKELEDKVGDISLQMSLVSATSIDTSKEAAALREADEDLQNKDFALKEAKNKLEEIEKKIEHEKSVSSGDSVTLGKLDELWKDANQAVIAAETAYNTSSLNQEKAQKALDNKKATDTKDKTISDLEIQQAKVQIELSGATKLYDQKQEVVTAKEKELGDLVQNISDEINLGSKYEAIVKAKEDVKKLEEQITGSDVKAPISGTIMSVNVKSGLETPDDGIVFTMQPEGEGYTMSFSVSNEQAKKVSVGDMAEPVNAWRYDDMQIVLSSIRPDPDNPAKNKLLLFNISGENVVPNQSINVSVGERSGSYDMIVPNSAIREDNDGKFVLIVESKSSPIGTRYIATRVDVEVIASDDTQSAISGALYGYEFVITTSTKPVEAGKQVRLPE